MFDIFLLVVSKFSLVFHNFNWNVLIVLVNQVTTVIIYIYRERDNSLTNNNKS